MDEVQNLRQQVRKLQRRLDQIEGGPAERERQIVSEIVGSSDETPDRRGGFAAACADSKANLVRQQLDRAIEELSANPHCIDSPLAEQDFRKTYGAVPSDQLDAIIRKARED